MNSHVAYVELRCKHCKNHTMVIPQEVERTQNNRLRCPFCNAMKLQPTNGAIEATPNEDGSVNLRAIKIPTV